jgi:hypothetical protein
MGYKTANIDCITREGAMCTDFYAQQSCTAGRASFILGEHPFRTGLLTIGMPGSPHLNAEEEPETYYYPKDPEFRKKFGPRGVIHSFADGKLQGHWPTHPEAPGGGVHGPEEALKRLASFHAMGFAMARRYAAPQPDFRRYKA